jgi:hypothetical protein
MESASCKGGSNAVYVASTERVLMTVRCFTCICCKDVTKGTCRLAMCFDLASLRWPLSMVKKWQSHPWLVDAVRMYSLYADVGKDEGASCIWLCICIHSSKGGGLVTHAMCTCDISI